ncbi:hypothetical protein [Hyalangium sp.]|uniref:hypothetical protein n=1 Tax=Hyalangium sp. TaxID=2028555 RepID=UPI00389A471D
MLRAALATALSLALFACSSEPEQAPRPCPTPQDTTQYRLPIIEVGKVGQVAKLTVPSPNMDVCARSVTEVTTTVTEPLGAVVPSTGAMTEIANQDSSSASRKLTGGTAEFTPTRWGWHTVRFDFGAVGGQVDARMFIADTIALTQTLPFRCEYLQRSRYGWLCETAYVRDLITVRTFTGADVSIVDDVLWVYDYQNGALQRYIDTGSGELVNDPPAAAAVPRYTYSGPGMLATRDDVLLVFNGKAELYAASIGGVGLVASLESPLLSDVTAMHRDGNWVYVLRDDKLVVPLWIDQAGGRIVPKTGFTVPGTEVMAAGPRGLVTYEEVNGSLTVRRLQLRDGGLASEARLELPGLLDPDSFVSSQALFERSTSLYVPRRVFVLLHDGESMRLGEVPYQRNTCSSACVLYPGVRRDLLFWPEGGMTKVVLLP